MTITNAQIAQEISNLVDYWRTRDVEFAEWLSGAADGGPYGDGRFPLSDYLGVTQYLYSPAALQAGVSSSASSAALQAALAADARDAALAAQAASEAARNLALSYQTGAQAARDLASMYASNAANSQAIALTYKNAAAGSSSAAAGSASDAEDSATAAASSAAAALDSAGDAASSAASSATSAAAAATFVPSLYTLRASAQTITGAWTFNAADNVTPLVVRRNAGSFGQFVSHYGTSGGNFIESQSSLTASKSLVLRATTDAAGTAGTNETGIIIRGRANTDLASFTDAAITIGGVDVTTYARRNVVNAFTAAQSIAIATVTPLTIQRTGNALNVNMAFVHDGGARYLGLDSTGALRFGSAADLNATGTLVSLAGHVHTIANVTGLQTALDGKAALNGNNVFGVLTQLTSTSNPELRFNSSSSPADSKAWSFLAATSGTQGRLLWRTRDDAAGIGDDWFEARRTGVTVDYARFNTPLGIDVAPTEQLDVNGNARIRGSIRCDGGQYSGAAGRTMLTDLGDGYLRINSDSHYINGAYTPGALRVTGALSADGNATVGGAVFTSGYYYAGDSSFYFYNTSGYSYGSWRVGGSRGGHTGVMFDVGTQPTLMYDASGAGGIFHQSGVGWTLFYNHNNWLINKPLLDYASSCAYLRHATAGMGSGRIYVQNGGSAAGSAEGDITFIW